MAQAGKALRAYLKETGLELDGDFLRDSIQMMSQMLMELEVEEQIQAQPHERTPERITYRNGYRDRSWETRVGEIELRIPKLRQGSYFPSLLDPRRRPEKALVAVIQEAYVNGVSTRKMDDLVRALGLQGIDKSKVSRLCQQLDEQVQAWRERALQGPYPYVWLDAVYLNVRQNHRVVSMALVIAIGVRCDGRREVLGVALGASEEEAFWTGFLRSLVQRGLSGVLLVISDAHAGLKAAIAKVLHGAGWQRCRVHCVRNILAYVPQQDKAQVAAQVRTLLAHPDLHAASQQLHQVVQHLRPRWPQAARVLAESEDDLLAFMAFPPAHWTRIASTNPLERVNREIKRRTEAVGIFPHEASALRLVGAVLMDLDDEWQVGRRYFSSESLAPLLEPDPPPAPQPEETAPSMTT